MGVPSVKVALAGVISLTALGGLFYYTYKEQAKNAPQTAALSSFVKESSKTLAELDSDGDGLKNWEESLWQTDPEKKDTDNDGTPDGEEIKNHRNPTKGGVDTVTDDSQIAIPDFFKTSTSTTDAVGKELFAKYLSLKKSGGFTATTQQGLIEDLLSSINGSSVLTPKYKKTDLTIVPRNEMSFSLYQMGMKDILDYAKKQNFKENEITVIYRAVQKQMNGLEELEPYIAMNDIVIKEYAKISVPADIADAHLVFLNAIDAYNETLKMIRLSKADPIRGMIGSTSYLAREKNMNESYMRLKTYMENK